MTGSSPLKSNKEKCKENSSDRRWYVVSQYRVESGRYFKGIVFCINATKLFSFYKLKELPEVALLLVFDTTAYFFDIF
jgi:hypothetical protein